MSERIDVAAWRKAMEGVTPGLWMMEIEADDRVAERGKDRQPEVYVCSDRTACDYTVVATMGRAESIPHMRKSFDADWIARCSPAGISKLLDEIERLRGLVFDSEALRKRLLGEVPKCRDHSDYTEEDLLLLSASKAVKDLLCATKEIEKLRDALQDLLLDVTIAQSNMRTASKYDSRWQGCAEAIQPRVDAAKSALLGDRS